MDERARLQDDRSLLETGRPENDYSGLLIEDRYLRGDEIAKSFFVGSILVNCAFDSVRMNNTEFSEASLRYCTFLEVDLSGSDFVNDVVEDSTFSGCSFANGEWRSTFFRRCDFKSSVFDHTTIALCRFENCYFDADSFSSLQQRAAQFNSFTCCVTPEPLQNEAFAARNFGLPYTRSDGAAYDVQSPETLEELCLLNSLGYFRADWFVHVARVVCIMMTRDAPRKSSSLSFIAMIVSVLTAERRISATTLLHLREIISEYIGLFKNAQTLDASVGLVFEVNASLLTVAAESESLTFRGRANRVQSIKILFESTFPRPHADALGEALSAGANEGRLTIVEFASGSTLIEYACTTVVSAGALLAAINYALRQATITLKRVGDFQSSWHTLQSQNRRRSKPPRRAIKARTEVPALLAPERAIPQVGALQEVVKQRGFALAQMDEPAKIEILVKKLE